MSKITEYTKVSSLSADDVLLVDGSGGTRTISASDAAKDFSDKAGTPDDFYGAYIAGTASGSIASFSDGADNVPMKSVKVALEPVQDLNGYDHPWPAGGGKNLLPMSIDAMKTFIGNDGSWSDNVYSKNGLTFTVNLNLSGAVENITVNGTATAETNFRVVNTYDLPAGSYTLTGCPSGGSNTTYRLAQSGIGYEFGNGVTTTTESSQSGTAWITVFNGATVTNKVFKPMIRLASVTDSTWEPYSNVCPITGWTGAKVTRCGKNLIPMPYQSAGGGVATINGVTFTPHEDGSITIDGTATANAIYDIRSSNTALPLKAGTYTIKGIPDGSINTVSIRVYIGNSTIGYSTIGYSRKADYTFTLNQSEVISLSLYVYNGYTANNEVIKPMLVYGTTATDYEPYTGDTYSITFPSSAGTVYGGTLDVTNGTLTVDWVSKLLNDPTQWDTWGTTSSNTVNFMCRENCSDRKKTAESFSGLICSYMPVSSSSPNNTARWAGATSNNFGIKSEALTIEQIKTDAADDKIMICYPLATPITYILTPQEITSLLGENNVWGDTGDSTVEYRADTKMYIDNAIAELQAMVLEG